MILTAKLRTSQAEKALSEPRGFRSSTASFIAAFSSELSPLDPWLGAMSSLLTMSSFSVSLGKDMVMVLGDDVLRACDQVLQSGL